MALMFILSPSALSYAIRSVAVFFVGLICWILNKSHTTDLKPVADAHRSDMLISALIGLIAGFAVFVLWIYLPAWPYSEPAVQTESPYAPQNCGWALTIMKLIGSAFIIAPAEEMFFRSFLYRRLISRDFTSVSLSRFDLSAFLWVIFLFTLEHNRPIAAALTGAVYGLLAIRFGISSAVIAHMTTNLVLALHVIINNQWQFW